MTTLREAAQQALEALGGIESPLCVHEINKVGAAMGALRAALEQPEAELEPVAWRYKPMIGAPWALSDDAYYVSCKRDQGYIVEPLYAVPPIEQAAIEKWKRMANIMGEYHKPLTEEDLREALRQCPHDTIENLRVRWLYAKDFARAIEAAHGIKETK